MAASSVSRNNLLGGGDNISTENESGTQSYRVVLESDGVKTNTLAPLPVKLPQALTLAPTVTVTAGAYVVGKCVGGLLDLSNAVRIVGGSGYVDKVIIGDKDANDKAMDVWFFHAAPSASTFTDDTAAVLNTADTSKVIGVAHVTDFTALGASIGQAQNLRQRFQLPAGRDLWAAIVVVGSGGATFTSTNSVSLKVGVTSD